MSWRSTSDYWLSIMLIGRKGTLGLVVLVEIFIYGTSNLVAEAGGKKIADIYWNTTNPIFYFDNRYHIFPVRLMDKVDIICPKYQPGVPSELMEHSMIYLVDRRSYESCVINASTGPRLVGVCMQPYSAQLITIVFRDFTPSPSALEFRPNRTYYVISTSNGSRSGLKNDRDGLCKYYNMRLQFVVKHRCRPKPQSADPGSVLGFGNSFPELVDDSEEFDECEENSGIPEEPPAWTKDRQPPPFPRQQFPNPRPRIYGDGSSSGASGTFRRTTWLHRILWSIVFLVTYRWLALN